MAVGVHNEIDEDENPSPLLKYRGTVSTDEKTGEEYFVGIVLRMNGRVEVYYDFTLVDSFYQRDN